MVFSFAWVDGGDAFVDRVDEDVFAFELSHLEGEFATLNVEIRNPRVGLLKPGRKRWCWLGKDGVALFHGRLVGIPTNIREEVVTLNFVARPSDFDARKKAVAAGMRSLSLLRSLVDCRLRCGRIRMSCWKPVPCSGTRIG